jgi:drug/metabolite transporter (DMT)-like permease
MSQGIRYILFATLAFAVMNVMAKNLSDLHPMQVVFFRALGTWIFIFPYMIYHKISVKGSHIKPLIARGIVGVLSLACFFIAVQRIPLGSAISIRYLGPIFGAGLAYYYLKEKINWMQWLSFAVAFSGVIVLKGFDIRIDFLSLSLLIVSAILVGGVFVLLRYLGDKEHHLTIINYFMMCALLLSLCFVQYWRMPLTNEWLDVCGIGISGLIGQVYMTKAFQTEDTSVLAPFKYMELIYAIILGYFMFDETYKLLPMIGIVLIIGGMMANVWAKGRAL